MSDIDSIRQDIASAVNGDVDGVEHTAVVPKKNRLTPVQTARLVTWLQQQQSVIEEQEQSGPHVAGLATAALLFDVTTNNVRGICSELGIRLGTPRAATAANVAAGMIEEIRAGVDRSIVSVQQAMRDLHTVVIDLEERVVKLERQAVATSQHLDVLNTWANEVKHVGHSGGEPRKKRA